MNPSRRSLCIVSRDPLQCSELVLSLQASLEPDDEVEIIMDRRRERGVFETKSEGHASLPVDRRRTLDVDLEVRTKGFAIVPGAAMAPRIEHAPGSCRRAGDGSHEAGQREEAELTGSGNRVTRGGEALRPAGVTRAASVEPPGRDRGVRGARRRRDRARRLESQGSDRSRQERSDREHADERRAGASG